MDSINLKARAKINLSLDVLRRREDGYHEVRMVMQTLDLFDRIHIKKTDSEGVELKTNLSFLPVDSNNLCCKAYDILKQEFGIDCGISIDLEKKIPVSAGMAGGSSDAATVLYGVNRIFNLGLTKKELMKRGVKIGADVPYCIMRGTAVSEGIGEILTPLPPLKKVKVLVAKPGIYVSTKFVYSNLNLNEDIIHPDTDAVIASIKAKNIYEMSKAMGNVLESVTIKKHSVIEEIKQFMMKNGAVVSLMSGSGPTVFGIYDDEKTAIKAMKTLRKSKMARQVFLTSTFNE